MVPSVLAAFGSKATGANAIEKLFILDFTFREVGTFWLRGQGRSRAGHVGGGQRRQASCCGGATQGFDARRATLGAIEAEGTRVTELAVHEVLHLANCVDQILVRGDE